MSQDGWKLLLHPGDARGPALLPASASPVRPSVCPPAVLLAEEVLHRLLLPACTPSLVGCPPATLTPSIHLDPMVIASPAQQGSQRLLPSLLRPSSSNCVCVHTCTRVYVYVCVCVCVCVFGRFSVSGNSESFSSSVRNWGARIYISITILHPLYHNAPPPGDPPPSLSAILSAHCPLACVHARSLRSCPAPCDPITLAHQPPLSRDSQARALKWVAISFPRGFCWPRHRTPFSCTSCRWTLYCPATGGAPPHLCTFCLFLLLKWKLHLVGDF